MTDFSTKNKLRQHNCKISVDHAKKLIICAPEYGDEVVLTTPVLYAWSVAHLCTAEGIGAGQVIKTVGFFRDDFVLSLNNDYRIAFVDCKAIFVYGLIISEKKGALVFQFDKSEVKTMFGSPFVGDRKTLFVSHSSKDKERVRSLVNDLGRHFDLFYDEKSLMIGDSSTDFMNEGLEACDAVLLFLSPASIKSGWVKSEYSYAKGAGKKILPIRLEECSPPPILRDTHYVDAFGEKKTHEEILLEIIAVMSRPG